MSKRGKSVDEGKIFDPQKYGMVICPRCNGQGYIQASKRQCCPRCGGFGFIIKRTDKDISADSVSKISLGGPNLGRNI